LAIRLRALRLAWVMGLDSRPVVTGTRAAGFRRGLSRLPLPPAGKRTPDLWRRAWPAGCVRCATCWLAPRTRAASEAAHARAVVRRPGTWLCMACSCRAPCLGWPHVRPDENRVHLPHDGPRIDQPPHG